ncbi:MAG TPA: MlaD family protein [Rhizomicrobium sp.]|nr:MlaD family protein [Rhizomicrobium sp.]
MQRAGIFETLLSAAVIVLAVGFLMFLLWQTGTGSLSSYEMSARIKSADGIKPGTDVRIGGVKVGTVESLQLNGRDYAVDVKLAIRDDIKLPEDSGIAIGSGMLSSPALTINPGRSKNIVPPGGTLKAR